MRILFIHPAIEISVIDVSRGYRSALERAGHIVRDYYLGKRMMYHQKALPTEVNNNAQLISKQASETILTEALYHQAELVVLVCGLGVHPIALWLLAQTQIPAAIVFTESPYEDEAQKQWLDLTETGISANVTVFTNDQYSAKKHGWNFLPPSYDSKAHFPAKAREEESCDVLMIGTGWHDRQVFLEEVDWTGIDLRIYGVWPDLKENSPLFEFFYPVVIENLHIAPYYRSAKICINLNRSNSDALTPGPRVYELAACEVFQISDPRVDMISLFGNSIPTYKTPKEMEKLIRYYLLPENEFERRTKAKMAHSLVKNETFDNRVIKLMSTVSQLQGVA